LAKYGITLSYTSIRTILITAGHQSPKCRRSKKRPKSAPAPGPVSISSQKKITSKGKNVSNNKKVVILVDDNPVNLMIGKNILKDGYQVITVPSGKKLFAALEVTSPDLILLDIDMPEMNGFQAIKRLKAGFRTAEIPVIFLSANNSLENIRQGFSLGAADFIQKPCHPPLLQKRVAA
jgi:CheY-like chemotaxis protein